MWESMGTVLSDSSVRMSQIEPSPLTHIAPRQKAGHAECVFYGFHMPRDRKASMGNAQYAISACPMMENKACGMYVLLFSHAP